MKKFITICRLTLIGLCLTLFSCQEEDTIPKPTIDKGESNYSIFSDETVEIKPIVTFEGETNYQWLENNKELSTKAILVYESETIGIHNISFTAVNKGGLASSEYSVNIKAIPLPIIEFAIKEDAINLKNGENIKFTPVVTSIRECTYIWEEDNKSLSTEKNYTYTSTKTGAHKISLKVTNKGGTSSKVITINASSSFAYGAFILNEGNMGNETGIVSFIDRNGVKTDSVYQKANNGEKLGNVTQDMWIANDKIYFIAQNGPEQIIVANRFTLKKESSITKDESGLDWPTHILVVSNSKAYVRDNAGLHTLDLNSMKITGNVNDAGKANKQKMEFINGKAIVAAGNELLIINPNDNSIFKKIEFKSSISSGAIEGKDQCIWISTDANTLHKIETNTFSIVNDYTVPNEFSLKGGFIPSCGLCASFKKDVVYWRDGGWNSAKLLKFDAETETTSTLINFAKDYTDAKIAYGDVAVDPITDEVYMGVIKGFGMSYLINSLYVINGETGNLTHPIYKNCLRFPTCTYFTENYNN